MNQTYFTRRRFLHAASQAALGGFGAYAMLGSLRGIGLSAARADTSGYRALVCVFLDGGNDGFNVLVPRDASGYATYLASRVQRAIPQNKLLPITPLSGGDFGLHPSVPQLQSLFQARRLAFLTNVGSLLAPITKTDYQNGANVPLSLFSHLDQRTQWMLGEPNLKVKDGGWAGRLADLFLSQAPSGSPLSMNISIAGNSLMLAGEDSVPYAISPKGVNEFPAQRSSLIRAATQQQLRDLAIADGHPLSGFLSSVDNTSIALATLVKSALAATPPLATVFPASPLAAQLAMVAQLIGARANLGNPTRQIFYVTVGGFDTHDDQDVQQAALLGQLSQALGAFDAAMTELGVSNSVTTFTHSDFGRTLTGNGDGTDHGWGSHHLIMGGGVRGNDFYGVLPSLAIGGPDDSGRGRIIPTSSVDQYAATLAKWLGAAPGDLNTLFPNLYRFATPDLGFML